MMPLLQPFQRSFKLNGRGSVRERDLKKNPDLQASFQNGHGGSQERDMRDELDTINPDDFSPVQSPAQRDGSGNSQENGNRSSPTKSPTHSASASRLQLVNAGRSPMTRSLSRQLSGGAVGGSKLRPPTPKRSGWSSRSRASRAPALAGLRQVNNAHLR